MCSPAVETQISLTQLGPSFFDSTTVSSYKIATTSVPPTTDDIILTGLWRIDAGPYGIGGPNVTRLATTTNGSSISFPITSASAFYINGNVNFDHGPYHVTINPLPDFSSSPTYYNGSSRWVGLNTITFLATGMNKTQTYQVELTNDSDLFYDQSDIVVYQTSPCVHFQWSCCLPAKSIFQHFSFKHASAKYASATHS